MIMGRRLTAGRLCVPFRRRWRSSGRRGRRSGKGADQRTSAGVRPTSLCHPALLAGQGRLGLDHAATRPLHGHLHAVRRRLSARRGHHSPSADRRGPDAHKRIGGICRQHHGAVCSPVVRRRHICRHHVHDRHYHQLPHHLRRRRRGQSHSTFLPI